VIFLISLETTDIFREAFFLCKGGDLSEVRFRSNGKRIATFLITGKDLDKLVKAVKDASIICLQHGQRDRREKRPLQ
jgi:hypothetical protein